MARRARRYGSNDPFTESTQQSSKRRRWTAAEERALLGHPDMSAAELSRALLRGRSPKAIQRKRDRMGRWSRARTPLCSRCDERPVWTESPKARAMGLCKGCYLHEMEHRRREDARANALRQSLLKERRRSGRQAGGTMAP